MTMPPGNLRTFPCDSCAADIFLCSSKNKRLPIDAEPHPGGNITIHGDAGARPFAKVWGDPARIPEGSEIYIAHFATCEALHAGVNPYPREATDAAQQGLGFDAADLSEAVERLLGETAQPEPPDPITVAFNQFHSDYPEVATELTAMASQAAAAGRDRIGMKMLLEVLRWNRVIAGLPDETEGYKLNNSYGSRYARLIMSEHPELEGIFETRELRS